MDDATLSLWQASEDLYVKVDWHRNRKPFYGGSTQEPHTWPVIRTPHSPPPVNGIYEPRLQDIDAGHLGVHCLVGLYSMKQHHRPGCSF